MASSDELDRLARLLGIDPFYTDIWGERRQVAESTKRDLVAAMGYACGTSEEISRALHELEERPWRRPLSPVGILDQGGYAAIEIVLPDGAAAVAWTIRLEDGSERSGRASGTELEWLEERQVDGAPVKRWRLHGLPQDLPLGYHRLTVSGPVEASMSLIVAPVRCLVPADLVPDRRPWGFGIQLYSLRSGDNWGMGDLADLGRFAEIAAELGADVVGLNPMHAMFPADPNNYGPYSPSNRTFLNVLYIDIAGLAQELGQQLPGDAETQGRIAALRGAELIDYPAVSALKMPALERLFEAFQARGGDRAFDAWRAERGVALERQALFDALHERFYGGEELWDWRRWPEGFRRPDGEGAVAFARDRADRVTFFAWLQWVSDRQFEAAAERGRRAGLGIGFYRDLAIASNPGGAASWSDPDVVLADASVGAPPDIFNPKGQNWGLAPLSPVGLLEHAYLPFIEAVRATMRHAGAIRIDHAMGLRQLYWIPARENHEGGAYVRYPQRDLLRLVALESHRERCAVIGEALGTVPEGFLDELAEAGIQAYSLLYFEREKDDSFRPREAYPRDALVSVTTHDLATLKGWWVRRDQEWRRELHLFKDEDAYRKEKSDREQDRGRLVKALVEADAWPSDAPPPDEVGPELAAAVHRFLAETPGSIMLIQIEDALGEEEQPNLPGTTTEHPNWRRRLPLDLEDLAGNPFLKAVVEATRAGRRTRG
ncbi:4-alpha-glucanotransferase [Arenibaculum pallidiluteum]|uniref:4-alpha-glucanotransferase n=1 Tax=Arenibaculum pallidiluteum TaxID=2812559 RepID=UPI001A963EB7|nr:4-alpha-glucanotransferase [Arenibaculum pallidiluteum]